MRLFCKHKYIVHARKEYEYDETIVVEDTKRWSYPITETNLVSKTVEILICEKCGKIRIIKY